MDGGAFEVSMAMDGWRQLHVTDATHPCNDWLLLLDHECVSRRQVVCTLHLSYLKNLGKNWQLLGGPRRCDLVNVFTILGSLEELTVLSRDPSWIWGRRGG